MAVIPCTVYQGPRRSGRAYYVTKRGDQDIVLSRIKSVYRHNCGEEWMRNTLPEFVIIGAILVMIVGWGSEGDDSRYRLGFNQKAPRHSVLFVCFSFQKSRPWYRHKI